MRLDIQAAVVALSVTSFMLPIVYLILRKWRVLDNPSARSSHQSPTLRGAGAAQILGAFSSWGSLGWIPSWVILGPIAFGTLGLVDDFRPQRPLFRLTLQLLLGVAMVSVFVSQPWYATHAIVILGTGTLFVVLLVNATNFMDGINGISALHGLLVGVIYWILLSGTSPSWAPIAAALAGISLAFLPWNWGRKAILFLGDSGSYLLGALFAVLVFATLKSGISPIIAVAPVSIYLVDVGRTLALRIHARSPLLIAHREHIYQVLTNCGISHPGVSSIVGAFTIVAGGIAIAGSQELVQIPHMVVLLTVVYSLYMALPTITRRSWRKH